MEETRDIAIEARESGKSAHKRLDGINGQIKKLGDSHEGMRADFNEANVALVEKIADVTATVRTTLKVAGAIAGCALAVCAGLTVYEVTHPHYVSTPPTVAAPQHPK